MVERLHAVGDSLFAVLSDGSWLQKPAGNAGWQTMPGAGWVTALTGMG
jgi:hypothetical protein